MRAGLALESIEVVENGIEVGELAAEVARLRGPARGGPLVLGVLGSALPSKGVLELCRAFASEPIEGLRLEVHGNLPPYHGDSSYVDELKELAHTTAALEVHGPYSRDQLPALLARLDAVAAPSRWEEVYGLTVREARAAGLPVLVSDAGDLPAVAAGGSAGLVVPRDDPRAWRAALERFVGDDEARSGWAAAAPSLRTTSEMTLQLVHAYGEALRALGRRPPRTGLWSRLRSWFGSRP